MLHNIGFSDVWYFPESVNETMFIPILRQRLREIYITHWPIGLNTCTSMRVYKQIKTTIDRSTYLDILETPKYRKVISQLRAKQVRDMLHNIGFSYVWYFTESVNETMFIPILRQRLRDIYITHWHIGLNTCTSMRLYKQIKTTIDRSTYLDILETPKYRKVISQLRLSSHKLTIETGRHNKISLNDRSAHIAR